MLKPIAAILWLFIAAATAQSGGLDYDTSDTAVSQPAPPSLAATSMTDADHMFRSGGALVTAGHFIAAGGVVLNVIGATRGNPDMALLGNFGFNIGLPLLGAGAGTVNRAAEKISPDSRFS